MPLRSLLVVLLLSSVSLAQYGSISDLKLKKPEDGEDVKSTPVPEGAIVLFDGMDTSNWVSRKDGKSAAPWKILPGGAMQVSGGDIHTKKTYDGKFLLHVEFRVPYYPGKSGQGRGNSGVYLQGRYEVQVLDSYGLASKDNDCGGIYGVAAPLVNACKAPTVWQSYDIEFTSPTFEGTKQTAPAYITVHQNGVKIHDKVALKNKKGEFVKNTTAGMGGDPARPGPIMLQDHGDPVQYRNIWLKPLKGSAVSCND